MKVSTLDYFLLPPFEVPNPPKPIIASNPSGTSGLLACSISAFLALLASRLASFSRSSSSRSLRGVAWLPCQNAPRGSPPSPSPCLPASLPPSFSLTYSLFPSFPLPLSLSLSHSLTLTHPTTQSPTHQIALCSRLPPSARIFPA